MTDDLIAKKLALGTVQFGLSYGVANATGKVPPDEVKRILKLADERGVRILDTAIAYGDSEATLGAIGVSSFRIVTKLPPVPDNCPHTEAWIETQVRGSLERLKIDKVYGLLLHAPQQLRSERGEQIVRSLERLKRLGWVQKLGLSVYSSKEAFDYSAMIHPEIVQLPINALDGRLDRTHLSQLKQHGTEIHARSLFLQGLLLMDVKNIPTQFEPWRPQFMAFHEWIAAQGRSSLAACLQFVAGMAEVDRLVVGVDSYQQWEEILKIPWRPLEIPPQLQLLDDGLLNPVQWVKS